ncbi:terminase small subunit [Paraburkholderia graminis]
MRAEFETWQIRKTTLLKRKSGKSVESVRKQGGGVAARKAGKRAVGRPSRYRPEYGQMIVEFFRIDLERSVEVVVPGKDGKPVTVTETVVNRFPTLTRFADSLGVSCQTLKNWAAAHPDFAHAHARAKGLQASLLIEGGMSGRYESRFVVLASKNLLGWRDRVEHKVEATLTQATVDELDRVYECGIAAAKAAKAAVAARKQRSEGGPRHD